MAKFFISLLVVVGIIGGGVWLFGSSDETPESNSMTSATNQSTAAEADEENFVQETIEGGGELIDYSEKALAQSDADTNILFFHADWCTVCNNVESNLQAGNIPEGVRILKVDYESSIGRDLAETYDIPIQYSMVQVDSSGTEITQWVNQSFFTIEDILERIQTS